MDKESMTIKCVVIGDGGVGKTSLMITYTYGEYPVNYTPTVFDNYAVKVSVDTKKKGPIEVNLCIFDTAGQEDYSHLRSLAYKNTDIFVVAFSVVEPVSFENVKLKWFSEIKSHFGPSTMAILVGTQSDMRNDPATLEKLRKRNMTPISKEMGENMATQLKCISYFDTSALLNYNVKNLMDFIIKSVVVQKMSKQKGCSIL